MIAGLSLLAFAVGFDAQFTAQFIAIHGTEAEANPLIRWIIEQGGIGAMYLFKWTVFVGAGWIITLYYQRRPEAGLGIVWALVVLHLPVLYWGWAMTRLPAIPSVTI